MPDQLTARQREVLFILMVEGREVPNPDLKNVHGVELKKAERERLNELKLIRSELVGRSYVHELTDKGWHRCAEEMGADRAPRSGTTGAALRAILGGLRRYMERNRLSLAHVFGEVESPRAPEAHDTGHSPEPAGLDVVEERIRAAYRGLAKRSKDWVGLAELRARLDGLPRADVDAVLKQLNRTPHVNLVPEADQKSLTDDDRAAAVRVGGEDKHLVSMDSA
jgi:hypothetical protein